MMEWPNQFLLVVLCLGVAALFAPWFIPRGRRTRQLGFIFALVHTACWMAYEQQLHLIARAGDPLIRIDLLLIVPLVILAWASAIGAIIVQGLRT